MSSPTVLEARNPSPRFWQSHSLEDSRKNSPLPLPAIPGVPQFMTSLPSLPPSSRGILRVCVSKFPYYKDTNHWIRAHFIP